MWEDTEVLDKMTFAVPSVTSKTLYLIKENFHSMLCRDVHSHTCFSIPVGTS